MIANESHAKWNARFHGVADSGGNAGIRNGNDEIGGDGIFFGEKATEHLTAGIDAAAEDGAVRTREIDMFENTLLMRLGRREMNGLDAGFGNAHHFAGRNFADVFRVEEIESAGFAGDDPGFFALRRDELAKIEWTEAARIADGVKLFGS